MSLSIWFVDYLQDVFSACVSLLLIFCASSWFLRKRPRNGSRPWRLWSFWWNPPSRSMLLGTACHPLRVQRTSDEVITLNASISACEKAAQWRRALVPRRNGEGLALWTVAFGNAEGRRDAIWGFVGTDGLFFRQARFLLMDSSYFNFCYSLVLRSSDVYLGAISLQQHVHNASRCLEHISWLGGRSWLRRPNVCTFNAALSACENASAWQEAHALLVTRRCGIGKSTSNTADIYIYIYMCVHILYIYIHSLVMWMMFINGV